MHYLHTILTRQHMRPVQLFVCALPLVIGCSDLLPGEIPESVLDWQCAGRGWGTWGIAGDVVFATTIDPQVFDVWQWHGVTLKRRYDIPFRDFEGLLSCAVLPKNRWLCEVFDRRSKHSRDSLAILNREKSWADGLAPVSGILISAVQAATADTLPLGA